MSATVKSSPYVPGPNFLLNPGPTPVPERVLQAMARQSIDFDTQDFTDMVVSVLDDLKKVFGTEDGRVFMYMSNGHGAWHGALENTLAPGDKALLPHTGLFAASWGDMARQFGVDVIEIENDWRHGADPVKIEAALREDTEHKIKAVMLVHTDTSTSAHSDVAATRRAMDAAGHPALLMVDMVASLGTIEFKMDEWGVDVAIGASQKALMMIPGLGMTAVSPKGLELSRTKFHKYGTYWDWETRTTMPLYRWFCGTPPEHLLWGLRESLNLILAEGLGAVFIRHQRLSAAVQAAVEAWGAAGSMELNILEPAQRSRAVTTIRVDENYDVPAFRKICNEQFNVALGQSMGPIEGKGFRIGHMGYTNAPFILGALASVQASFKLAGIPYGPGAIEAAISALVD